MKKWWSVLEDAFGIFLFFSLLTVVVLAFCGLSDFTYRLLRLVYG